MEGVSSRSNTLFAPLIAVWTSVITPVISLKGFVYWLAYVKRHDRPPTDSGSMDMPNSDGLSPCMTSIAPSTATAR